MDQALRQPKLKCELISRRATWIIATGGARDEADFRVNIGMNVVLFQEGESSIL